MRVNRRVPCVGTFDGRDASVLSLLEGFNGKYFMYYITML